MSDKCPWCGVSYAEHDYEQRARKCYPKRITELEAENARLKRNWEVLLSSFRMHSPKMNGEHCWEFRRMHSLRGSSLEEALRRYFKQEFDYDLQQLEQPEAKPE